MDFEEVEYMDVSYTTLIGTIVDQSKLGMVEQGVMQRGIPCPKKLKGVKYQGSGWRDRNKSFEISAGSLVETISSSSSSEISYSMEIRPRGRLSVMISFTCGESGGSRICVVVGVWISGWEILEPYLSISGSKMGFLSKDSPVSDLVWMSSVICKSVATKWC